MKFRELGWAGGKGRALGIWHFGISSLCKYGTLGEVCNPSAVLDFLELAKGQ